MARITARKLHLMLPMAGAKRLRPEDGDRYCERGGISHLIVLNDISFQAEAGDRIGVIGRNGSGKSTLLRVIAGIYRADSGDLSVDGKPHCLFSVNLGMQSELTGRENIFLRGIIGGQSRKDISSKLDEIIAFSELEEFIDLPIRTYSRGMSTRLAFSISTAFSPEILLLDEWIGAGDRSFQRKAAARMHALVDDATITVLASHNRGLLSRVCNKMIWLHAGKLMAFGQTEKVYAEHDEFYAKAEAANSN